MSKTKKISEKKLRLDYIKKDKTAYQIAQEYNMPIFTIKYHLKKYNIKKYSLNKVRKVSNKLVKKWIKLFIDGNSIYFIHKQTKEYSYDTIRNYLVRNNMNVNLHSRNNNRYEEFVDEWVVLANNGNSAEEISKNYKCTANVIRRKLLKRNIELKTKKEIFTERAIEKRDNIINNRKLGYSMNDISNKLDIPHIYISNILREENLTDYYLPKFLKYKSEDEIKELKQSIINEFSLGKPLYTIALQFNASIYDIKRVIKEKYPEITYFKTNKVYNEKRVKLNRFINYIITDVLIYDKKGKTFKLNSKYNSLM